MIQRAGYPVLLKNFKIVNLMGTADTGLTVDLMRMVSDYRRASNEVIFMAERPHGCAVYKFSKDSLEGHIHHTGKVGEVWRVVV